LQAIPFTDVVINDQFWAPRRAANRAVSLPMSLDKLVEAGNIDNLDRAAAGEREGFIGPVFADSDLYKALEAVAYSLATDPDPALEARADEVIAKIAAAQMPDGYLNTSYQVRKPDQRWTNLRDDHELYCAGHLFEAAAAHYQATGKRTLLDVAVKLADHIDARFGEGPGKVLGYPGHPEIELALVKLGRVTGEQRYLDLARFFVVNRGRAFFADEHGTAREEYRGEYWQDHLPIREHSTIVGHSVRAGYLYSAVVDVAAETGDTGLLEMAQRVWDNTVTKRMYVTGGIGSSAHNEGFTSDYDLPNLSAYQETCASISLMMFGHRLNLVTGDARYADIVELALYNGFLAGVSLDGRRYFYDNPLASDVGIDWQHGHHRQEWFGCACCPPNVTRTLAALGGYAYAASDDGVSVNLYIGGDAHAQVNGQTVSLHVTTNYPWDGRVQIAVTPETEAAFAFRLRVPAWCEGGASVQVNGAVMDASLEQGYLVVHRSWKPGDVVTLELPMAVRKVAAHPSVKEDRGCVALMRGPLVYCVEDADNDNAVPELGLPLHGAGEIPVEAVWPAGRLYQTTQPSVSHSLTAVPYYAWDNRAPGAMRVWIPAVPSPQAEPVTEPPA
jgi:DUF1680 family protein